MLSEAKHPHRTGFLADARHDTVAVVMLSAAKHPCSHLVMLNAAKHPPHPVLAFAKTSLSLRRRTTSQSDRVRLQLPLRRSVKSQCFNFQAHSLQNACKVGLYFRIGETQKSNAVVGNQGFAFGIAQLCLICKMHRTI